MEAHDSKNTASDETVPGYLLTTLLVGLPFAGILATFHGAGVPTGNLALMQLLLLVEGLTLGFFWRRLPGTTAKTMGLMLFVVGVWAYMGACLMAGFGGAIAPHGPWAKYAIVLGALACGAPAVVFASLWALHQSGAQQVQAFAMGFAALALAVGYSLTSVGSMRLAAKSKGPERSKSEVHGAAPSHAASEHHEASGEPAAHEGGKHGAGHETAPVAAKGHGHDVTPTPDHHASSGDTAEPADEHPVKHAEEHAPKHAAPTKEEHATEPSDEPAAAHDGEPGAEPSEHAAAAPSNQKQATAHSNGPHWTYDGSTDPAHWASLKSEWDICATGREQSPVDIPRSAVVRRNAIQLSYGTVRAKVTDNGHTIQVNVDGGHKAVINQHTYELKQFHFHTPSEHQLSGVSYPLEVHFVHKDEAGKLAVIGAFIESGDVAKEMRKVIGSIPNRQGAEQTIPALLDLAQILPRNLSAYQYPGSLTTPPCSEGVVWSVLQQPITFSSAQIRDLRAHYSHTNRPVMPLGDRRIGTQPALSH